MGLAVLLPAGTTFSAVAESATNAPAQHMILIDPLGQAVAVHTNRVPPGFLPPPSMGLKSQVPTPARGHNLPEPLRQRLEESREGSNVFTFFPAYEPRLMPYLASQDSLGNTAVKPGPLIPRTPGDVVVQQDKYLFSGMGLRYSLQQTLTWVGMSDVMQGDNTLGFYTLDLFTKWAILDAPAQGAAGWLSTKIEAKTGIGEAGDTQSAARNLGSATDPTSIWSKVNGLRVPELAWQQSVRDGEIVLVAGMVGQGNYFDGNTYANSGRGQFLNSALIDTMVMPLPNYNFGVNLQWQPVEEWYGMIGGSVGQAQAGYVPWTDFDWDNWDLLAEFGYAPRDFLGLGPGIYRIQPFIGRVVGTASTNYTVTIPGTAATTNVNVTASTLSPIQGGLSFNFQQQLGKKAPFGWFGRFGFGGSQISQGAQAQIGTGFVMRGPFEYLGLFPSRGHDAAGLGFVWTHPGSADRTLYHQDEYVLELGYALQLTHTAKLQPDLQVVWNPVYNPDPGPAAVVQVQLDIAW